jgi:hypothetical protein
LIVWPGEIMPHGFVFRVLISLALMAPSFLLWLVLRFMVKNRGLSVAVVVPWLKLISYLVLGLYVIFSAMDKSRLANGIGINFGGIFWVLNWVQRQSKLSEQAPTVLNISGRESVSAR